MKKNLLLAFFILYCIYSFAQSKSLMDNGHLLPKKTIIKATAYTFPENVYQYVIDTIRNQAHILLRAFDETDFKFTNKGSTLIMNLENSATLWKSSDKFNYEHDQNWMFGDRVVSIHKNKTSCTDLNDGKITWKKRTAPDACLPNANLIIAYGENRNIVEGYNGTDGKSLWSREISKKEGWYFCNLINDTSVLISAAGLHCINTKTGSGWDHSGKTTKQRISTLARSTMITASILTLSLAMLNGGGLVYIPLSENTLHQICSKPMVYKERVYYADSKQIRCFSLQGAQLWSTELPKELASTSGIFQYNDKIILVNYGLASTHSQVVMCGAPFVAIYDAKSGKCLNIHTFHGEDLIIKEYSAGEGSLQLLFNNSLVCLSLQDGSLLARTTISDASFLITQGTRLYFGEDESFEWVNKNKAYTYLCTSTKLVELNELLVKVNEWPIDKLYTRYLNTKKYTFIGNKTETYVLDDTSKPIAWILSSNQSKLIDNKLFDAQDKDLIVTDLSQLTAHE